MNKVFIPKGYESKLSVFDTQVSIELIKRTFEDKLAQALNLKRISAPLFVEPKTGLNDNLNGTERPVSFDIPAANATAEIVHSLAKWKRMALKKYGFWQGRGLYTDMNAVRRDEDLDNIHSIYVDQWDWERVISREERNIDFLKDIVTRIVGCICDTLDAIKIKYPQITTEIVREPYFITSQELLDMYPEMSGKERETAITKKYGTVFIMQIGADLSNGKPHDGRAPDYDDWQLNGDLLVWNDILGIALELSSMGIRVDETSLAHQLKVRNCEERKELAFHKALLNGELPLTIGGGIGQSRLCLLLLQKAHIGEVQVSVWDEETLNACKNANIEIL